MSTKCVRTKYIREVLAACALGVLPSCIPATGFDEEEYVKTTRVLAVVADPPVVRPGQDARLSALVVDPEGRPLRYRWFVCAQPEVFGGGPFSGVQFGGAGDQPGCADDSEFRLDLGSAETAVFPGAVTATLFARLADVASAFGDDLSPDLIERVANEVGVAVTVELRVFRGDERVVTANKRVLVRAGELDGTNPWPPRITVGTEPDVVVVDARGDRANDTFQCTPERGTPPSVMRGQTIALRPSYDNGAWLETYRVLGPTGMIRDVEESAFFSWFATAGSLREGTTEVPIQTNEWTAPNEPGRYPLWLVVRDGHGGTQACAFQIDVR